MIIYIYDEITKEYLLQREAQADPLNPGQFLKPDNSTVIAPPDVQDEQIACYIEDDWVIKKDHRGHWQVKLDDVTLSIVDYIGNAQAGYQFISDEVYADYESDHDKYKVQDGVFVKRSDEEYEEIKRQKEKERIGNLKCTKRVFVLMLEELGLDYFEQIEPAINANRQAKLEWNLCVELERKNPLLEQLGQQFGVTATQLDILFKTANNENSIEDLRATRGDIQ